VVAGLDAAGEQGPPPGDVQIKQFRPVLGEGIGDLVIGLLHVTVELCGR
jgi:hypothetical protein